MGRALDCHEPDLPEGSGAAAVPHRRVPATQRLDGSRDSTIRAAVEKDPASTAELASNGGTRSLDFSLAGWRAGQPVRGARRTTAGPPPTVRSHRLHRPIHRRRCASPSRCDSTGPAAPGGSTRSTCHPSLRQIVRSPRTARARRPAPRLGSAPPFDSASSLLFVVDLTNASPGDAGTIRDFRPPAWRTALLAAR